MSNDREMDSVLMNIKNSSGAALSLAVFSAGLSLKLVSYLFRLAKKGAIASGIADRFMDFQKKSEGNYTTYNIPLSKERADAVKKMNQLELQLEKESNPLKKAALRREIESVEKTIPEVMQLKRMGIDHCVLPKLNGSSNTIQVAVTDSSDQRFKNWYLNHLTTEMNGGEKNMEVLKVFTEGNYSVLNMPFESEKDIDVMKSDLKTLGVNYSILPDLKVGDGYTQIAIANSDRDRVESWFRMWKNKAVSEGREVNSMYDMNDNAYVSGAEVSADEYIRDSDKVYQDIQQEFEEKSTPVPWNAKMKTDKSPQFIKLDQDANYKKVTINVEKLVKQRNENVVTKKYEQEGMFVSRVPYTSGNREKTLILPKENVFLTDNDKTVVAFLDKRMQHTIVNADGTIKKMSVEELHKNHYDKVERGFKKVKDMAKTTEKSVAKSMAEQIVQHSPNLKV